jgi:hypothetical protein
LIFVTRQTQDAPYLRCGTVDEKQFTTSNPD